MNMAIERAMASAHDSLARFRPGEKFRLTPLKPPFKAYDTWVFRCKVRERNESVVCKTGARNESGRAKLANQYERLSDAHRSFSVAKYSVPEPLAFYREECALLMEDCRGSSLKDLISGVPATDELAHYLEQAGKWIALYQAPTTQITGFDPTPHVNWLRRKIGKHEKGEFPIPDHRDFMRCFDQLAAHAIDVKGLPHRQCVTHQDFHSGNIVFRKNGKVYGIDFENTKKDVALRDMMSLLFDVLFRSGLSDMNPASANAEIFHAFRKGCADTDTHEDVYRWFKAFSALNGWSNLGTKTAFTLTRARKLLHFQSLYNSAF